MSRKGSYIFSAAAAAVALGGLPGLGHYNEAAAATAAYFSFENPTFSSFVAQTANYSADVAGTGVFFASHAGNATFSSPAGNGSAHAFSSNNFVVGDYYQFSVPTTTLTGVIVQFDQASSASGPGVFTLQYSTDGTTFTPYTTYTLPFNAASSAFSSTANTALSFKFDLSTVPGLVGDPSAAFRLVESSNTGFNSSVAASGGTDRVDNIIVSDSTPEPTGLALMTVAGAATMIRRRKAKTV